MVAGYHGYRTNLMELRRRFSVSQKGATLRQLMQMAQQIDMGTRPVKLDLDSLNQLKLPCILHWNFNHFVVLSNVEKDSVVIYDPAHGRRLLSFEELSRSFTGVALELWPDKAFEKQEKPPRVRLRNMLGQVSGLYRSLGQILILSAVLEIFSLISPMFMQLTLDKVLLSNDQNLLTQISIGFLLLLVMQQAVSGVRQWVSMHMSTLLNVQWRANMFNHLMRLPTQYFEKRHLGDIVSRFSSVDVIQNTLTSTFLTAVLDGFMTIATLIMMLIYSPKLAMVAIAAMTLYALGRWIWYSPLRNATEEEIIHGARQSSHFLESVRGARAIKLFQREDDRRAVWLGLLIEQINAGLRTQKLNLFYGQLNGFLFGIENVLIIWIGASMVMDNPATFTIGMLMAFSAYKGQFDSRVANLIDSFFQLRMLQLQGERLADIALQEPEDTESFMDLENLSERKMDISLNGLKFRYSDQEPWVLDGIDLNIKAGESIALVGASGCGKSTLIHLLLGIYIPTEGQMRIAGLDMKQMGLNGSRSVIASVLQDDVLFAGSLSENISFFDPNIDMDWVIRCAEMAAIHDDILLMPMNYNTLVGDMGTVLSGGQKQRIMLARALYKKPKILILDEATSHLDVQCEQRVNAAIRSLDITRVMVAHRRETIESADRVVAIAGGKVIMDTSADSLKQQLGGQKTDVINPGLTGTLGFDNPSNP